MPNFPTGPTLPGLPRRPEARAVPPLPLPTSEVAARAKAALPLPSGAEPSPPEPRSAASPAHGHGALLERIAGAVAHFRGTSAPGPSAVGPSRDVPPPAEEVRAGPLGRDAVSLAEAPPRQAITAALPHGVPERTDGAVPLAIAEAARKVEGAPARAGLAAARRGVRTPEQPEPTLKAPLFIVAASLVALGAVLLL